MPKTEDAVFNPRDWIMRRDAAVLGVWDAEGLTYTDENDIPARDRDKFRQRCLGILEAESHGDTMEFRNNDAIERSDFAAHCFPTFDFSKTDTDFDIAVRDALVEDAWNETDMGESKPLQRLVRTKGLFMARATPIQGRKVVYVSSNEDLFFLDVIKPVQDSVDRAARKLGKQLAMGSLVMPEIAKRASKTLTDTVDGASAAAKTAMGELVAKAGS